MKNFNERLRDAARSGSEANLKDLLMDPGCDALAKNKDGMTALMWASWNGHEKCVRVLLPVSDALAKDVNGTTALMWAVKTGNETCIQLLLPKSDVRIKDTSGITSLMWAASYGHEECIRILLPASNVLAKDKDGWTASAWARNSSFKILAEFIDAYALSQTEQASIGGAACPKTPRKRTILRV